MDSHPTHRTTVLVVEDNPDGAATTADILRLCGHDVRIANSPRDALRQAAERPPDVVLLDIGLPGMDGYELARRLCDQSAARPVLIAITGYGNLDERSRREGFDHHFLKPVDPADLTRVLAACQIGRARAADLIPAAVTTR